MAGPLSWQIPQGVRYFVDPLEREGVRRAKRSRQHADLVVVVTDATENALPEELLEGNGGERAVLVVVNKIDLLTPERRSVVEEATPDRYATSAVTGVGIEALLVAIQTSLVPIEPTPGAAVPFALDQVQQLLTAEQLVLGGQSEEASKLLRSMLSAKKS